jgi:hypothetical protein
MQRLVARQKARVKGQRCMIRPQEALLLPVTKRLQLLRRSFESTNPPPADTSLSTFVGRFIFLQPNEGGMNHCRRKNRTASSRHESLSSVLPGRDAPIDLC